MFSRTFSKMTRVFSSMEKDMDDMFKTMDEEFEQAFKDDPPKKLEKGAVETVTEETETRPDGTVIRRKVTRRTSR